MPLQWEVENLDAVEEAHRPHYSKTEAGAFRLNVEGFETAEELREGLRAEVAAKKAARAEVKRLEALAVESAPLRAEQEQAARHRAELEAEFNAKAEQENTRKLAEFKASQQALIAGMRADLERVTEENAVLDIAAELARFPEYREVLLPHIHERLQGRRDENGKFSDATRAEVAAQLRGDSAFAPIILGASPQERAIHAKRVAETIGAKTAQQPITRAKFEALTPEKRTDSVRAGVTILDS
jgi:hypothetical protein